MSTERGRLAITEMITWACNTARLSEHGQFAQKLRSRLELFGQAARAETLKEAAEIADKRHWVGQMLAERFREMAAESKEGSRDERHSG